MIMSSEQERPQAKPVLIWERGGSAEGEATVQKLHTGGTGESGMPVIRVVSSGFGTPEMSVIRAVAPNRGAPGAAGRPGSTSYDVQRSVAA